MTYVNGDIYEGDWVQDMRHGTGTLNAQRREKSFKGKWINDHPA